MSVEVEYGTITPEGAGLSFGLSHGSDDVEIEVEFPDYGSWTSGATAHRYVTISREDWDAIVAHLAALDNNDRGGESS
jgi:hypothetical protein